MEHLSKMPADAPVFLACPLHGRWLPSRADPDIPPQTQGVEEVGRLTPVITAQSDTVTRRNMIETRMAPFMVTWGEGTTPPAPLPVAGFHSASCASWEGQASGPLPPPRFIRSDPGCLWVPVSALPFPVTSVIQMIAGTNVRPESLMTSNHHQNQ